MTADERSGPVVVWPHYIRGTREDSTGIRTSNATQRKMMSKPITADQAAEMNWCDVSLCGISWVEDGRNVVLDLLMPPSDDTVQLTCRWVRGFQASLAFERDTAGYPLSWDGSVKRAEDGAWEPQRCIT